MKIEIDLPDEVITSAAASIWRSLFSAEDCYRGGNPGYDLVRTEVVKHLRSDAVVELIRTQVRSIAAEMAEKIVREVVTNELRKMVRNIAAQEYRHQTLFDKPHEAGSRQ